MKTSKINSFKYCFFKPVFLAFILVSWLFYSFDKIIRFGRSTIFIVCLLYAACKSFLPKNDLKSDVNHQILGIKLFNYTLKCNK